MALVAQGRLPARKAAGTPLLIGAAGASAALEKLGTDKPGYNEAWLQQLAFGHPEVLPIGDIEPGFGAIWPVAMEVPCAHGYIDDLFITASGDIVLVEAKLWRNPQARREVVAQALDYVAALMSMGYEAFENACRKGQGMAAGSLYGLIAERPEALDEITFIDAVSRNLAHGRMLVIALGDGIRAETEALADLLQSHAGAHFTFALVELAIWRNAETGDLIALPSTLAQTVMITRGVVRVEAGSASISPVPLPRETSPRSISGELFFEELARRNSHYPDLVAHLLERLESLGVRQDMKAALNLKSELPDGAADVNFGSITKTGIVWTDTLACAAPAEIAQRYNQALAQLIDGSVAYKSSGESYLVTNGKSLPRIDALLPQHEDGWVAAIKRVLDELRMAPDDREQRLPADGAPKEVFDKSRSFEALYQSGLPFLAEVMGRPRSPVLGYIRTPTGFAWCDDGVVNDINPGNPFHLVEGPVEDQDGRVRCDHTLLRPIGDTDVEALRYWREASEMFGGHGAMRAKFEARLRAHFLSCNSEN